MNKLNSKSVVMGLMTAMTNNQHDSAACFVLNGETLGCYEEERYVRYKHAYGHLPIQAISAGLKAHNLDIRDISIVAIPTLKHVDLVPRTRLFLEHYFGYSPKIYPVNHQVSHMASAFFPSDFEEAMLISADGQGDYESLALGVGKRGTLQSGSGIKVLETKGIDQSLGIFYQTLTQYLGFSGAGDEYKVMGLSAYGNPGAVDLSSIIKVATTDYLINPEFLKRDPMPRNIGEPRFGSSLLAEFGPARLKGSPLTQKNRDFARAIQDNFENAFISTVRRLHEMTGIRRIGLAGGCALNCLANMKLLDLPFIEDVFIQPASTDQGSALGAALIASFDLGIEPKTIENYYLGSSYTDNEILKSLKVSGVKYEFCDNVAFQAAKALQDNRIIAVYNGRSEFGPRALGNRSILANPINVNIKNEINQKIKFREEFRPFAPAVLGEKCGEIFNSKTISKFMTITSKVSEDWRSKIPGIVHVDGTARPQAVWKKDNESFYNIVFEFHKLTQVPVVINTSFNVMGEPIVETPLDAIKTFFGSGLDDLFIGNYHLTKNRD